MGIKLFGKNILQIYTHHIMRIDYERVQRAAPAADPEHTLRKLDLNRIAEELGPIGTTVTPANLKRLVSKNGPLCEGFVFSAAEGKPVGTIWVMYKGADDLEYRIRHIDAYIFDVYVNDAYRGRGYAGAMIRTLMEYLHGKGIDSAHLAVALGNKSAIRAYEKTGFITEYDRKFARVVKINLPYHAL